MATNPETTSPSKAVASGVVYLDSAVGARIGSNDGIQRTAPLLRELARQAFLIAARDELGLSTRDSWLGSQKPADDEAMVFDMNFVGNSIAGIQIVPTTGPSFDLPRSNPILLKPGLPYQEFMIEMEAASRKSFVDMLKKAGFKPTKKASAKAKRKDDNKDDKTKAIVADCEQQLADISLFAQFGTLRDIHKAIREHGESPELLGLLVCGYAQLGMLSELNWHQAHKVFKARALLYARRMVVKYPKSAAALDCQAYAFALSGLQASAIESLAAADRKARGQSRAAGAPLIEAYCHFDLGALEKAEEDKTIGSQAKFLKFLALEHANCDTLTIEHGIKISQTMPEYLRIYETLSALSGVGLGQKITAAGPLILSHTIRPRLQSMHDLPSTIKSVLNRKSWAQIFGAEKAPAAKPQDVADIIQALLASGTVKGASAEPDQADDKIDAKDPKKQNTTATTYDTNELRWETLGLLLRETVWLHAWQRTRFIHDSLGLPAEESIDEMEPLWKMHPYHSLMLTYSWQPQARDEALNEASKLDPETIEVQGSRFVQALIKSHPSQAHQLKTRIFINSDDTMQELGKLLQWNLNKEVRKVCVDRLLAVSPDSPRAEKWMVDERFDEIGDRLPIFESRAEEFPELATALGRHAADSGDLEKAERFLKLAANKAHDWNSYMALAEFYKTAKKEDQRLATLEQYLEQPTYGLEHAKVRTQIADHFFGKGELQKAKSYAEAAAECYSAWALACAARCNEAVQDWEAAEKYNSALAERYPTESLCWYFFCKRTGKGNSEEARKVALQYVRQAENTSQQINWQLGQFYLLEKLWDDALKFYDLQAKTNDPYYLMQVAMLHDEGKRPEKRDETLQKIVFAGRKFLAPPANRPRIEVLALAEAMIDDLKQGGKADFDIIATEKLLPPESDPIAQCNFHYFLGRYLDQRGKKEEAIEQWKQCMKCEAMQVEVRTLAGEALVLHQVKPEDYENPLLKSKDSIKR